MLCLEGCAALPFLAPLLGSSTSKPLVNTEVQVGDREYKGLGTDQKVKENKGHIVGRDEINNANARVVNINQMSWFNVFETLLLIAATILGTLGWSKSIREWRKGRNENDTKGST